LLYRGDDGAVLNAFGLLLVFLSALSYAIYLVTVNRGELKQIPTLKLTLYVIFFGLFLFAFRFQVNTFAILSEQPLLWLSAFCMALFPTAVSLICTSAAIQKVGSTPVAILGAMEPVTAVAIAILIFHELLTVRLAIGMLLVIISVTFIIAGGNITHHLLRVRKMFPRIKRKTTVKE
jgi:drug/metabolite transporter (DMT)-like permease